MQRINAVNNPQGKAKQLLQGVRQAMGGTPNMFKAFANAPAALEGYLNFNAALSGGVLNATLREQIALAVAGFNGCDYCASAHTVLGGHARVPEDELEVNIAGHSGDKKTHAALAFAHRLMETRGRVTDVDLQAVRDVGFSNEEIIEILAHVALNTFSNYFNETVLTEIDFPKVSTQDVRRAA